MVAVPKQSSLLDLQNKFKNLKSRVDAIMGKKKTFGKKFTKMKGTKPVKKKKKKKTKK